VNEEKFIMEDKDHSCIEGEDRPLTPAELEMLEWNIPVLKPSGKLEPPDVEYGYMLEVMATAKRESGRLITNLDELAQIARKHNQGISLGNRSSKSTLPI
jgi:hypothetical protein